jgi:predicted nuclease of predicted toxin-antitoxin system
MRLLLDENLPKRLKQDLEEHEITQHLTRAGQEFQTVNYWDC